MRILKTIYRKFFPSSTIAHTLFWRFRYILTPDRLTNEEIEADISHPHRREILDEFQKFAKEIKVLEIGSSWGANLLLLSRYFPVNSYFGIDISGHKVNAGNKYFRDHSIDNVSLKCADMTCLKEYRDDEFDVIISDAALIYVDNSRITDHAREIVRIARLGLILVEFDDESDDPFGKVIESAWIRDYRAVFRKHADSITKRSFTPETWPGKWARYGKIITILLTGKSIKNEGTFENN